MLIFNPIQDLVGTSYIDMIYVPNIMNITEIQWKLDTLHKYN